MERRLDAIMAGAETTPRAMVHEGGTGGQMMHSMGHGHHHHHGHSGPDPQVMASLNRLQEHMDKQTVMLEQQQQYLEQRDAWIEQRIMFMERRCEKVELSSERLIAALQKLDVESLARIPEQLDALKTMGYGASAEMSGGGGGSGQSLQQLQSLGSQMTQLLQHAEEDAEARKTLWKVEFNVNQMKATERTAIQHMQSLSHQISVLLQHAEVDGEELLKLVWPKAMPEDMSRLMRTTQMREAKNMLWRVSKAAAQHMDGLPGGALPPPPGAMPGTHPWDPAPQSNGAGPSALPPPPGQAPLRNGGAEIARQGSRSSLPIAADPSMNGAPMGLPSDFHAPPIPGQR